MMQCVAEGHIITALANLKPQDTDELDSYMFQTVGHHAIDLYAEAMGLPLYRRTIEGGSIEQGIDYHVTPHDEVEDLYQLLKQIKDELSVEAVSVGAILSDYQRVRVEHVCRRLGLTALSYLWRRDQAELMQEIIQSGVHAILIKVAALGLEPDKHLNKTLADIYPHMMKMKDKFGLNVCGEGGEYETFTLDCPLFEKKIVIDQMETVIHSDDAFAQVSYLRFNKMHLENKNLPPGLSQLDMVKDLPMKLSDQLITELFPGQEPIPENEPIIEPAHRSTCTACHLNALKGQYVRVHRGSTYITVSGIVGLKTGDSSIQDITHIVMEQLKDILSKHNTSSACLLAVHLYVQNMKNFSLINGVYKQYFDINPPIRVCVETCLPENVLLQLDCIAHTSAAPPDIRTMHVQGLSHWAPANIGPYSQAKKIGSLVLVAGQIALRPADLAIIEGGIVPETRLSLRHVSRVLAAMTTGAHLQDVVSAVCYVTCVENVTIVQQQLELVLNQSLNDCDSERRAPFHVLYVVVPALPRSSLVEWQVYSMAGGETEWQEWSSKIQSDTHTSHFVMYQRQSDVNTALSFTISIEAEDVSNKVDEYSTLQQGLSCVQTILQKASATTDHLRVIRIFYRANLFDLDLLNQAYDAQVVELMKSTDQACPTAVFIPILGFQKVNTVLCIYH